MRSRRGITIVWSRCRLILACCVICSWSVLSAAANDQPVVSPENFLAAYRNAIAPLLDAQQNSISRVEFERQDHLGEVRSFSATVYSKSGSLRLDRWERNGDGKAGMVVVGNATPEGWSFTLFDAPDSRWKIMEAGTDKVFASRQNSQIPDDAFPAFAATHQRQMPILELFESVKPRFGNVRIDQLDGVRTLTVDFEWRPENPKVRAISGTLSVCMDLHFATRRLEYVEHYQQDGLWLKSVLDVEYEYGGNVRGFAVPARASRVTSNSQSGVLESIDGRIQSIDYSPKWNGDEFLLSAFMLITPRAHLHSWPPIVWINLLCLAAILFGWWLRRSKQRCNTMNS